MSIRFKFILVLLAFSLLPLMVFFAMHQRVSSALGEDIYHVAKTLMLQTIGNELEEAAVNHTWNISREMQAIEKAVTACAEVIGRDASGGSTRDLGDGFSDGDQTIRTSAADCENRWTASGDIVSGIRIRMTGEDNDSFSDIQTGTKFPIPILDTTASLFSSSRNPKWIPPGTVTGAAPDEAPLTVLVPIIPPEGSIAGVLAVGVDTVALLERTQPSSQWSMSMKSLLVWGRGAEEDRDGIPYPVAVRQVLEGPPGWVLSTGPLQVDLPERERVVEFFNDFNRWERGQASLPYQGTDAIWAFARSNRGFGLITMLPHREVFFFIHRTQMRLKRWYRLDTLVAVAAVVLLLVTVAVFRSKKLLDPFMSLVDAFQRLSKGDFSVRLTSDAGDERKQVADAFNDMTHRLKHSMRVQQALEVAREVQQNFLPDMAPRVPGWDIVARIQYCEETGGDAVDFLHGQGNRLGVVVSDVTGHGVGAALLMATARALFRGNYDGTGSLCDVISRVNRDLARDIGDTGRFVTLFFLEIDTNTGALRWVRAGHDPAWHFSAASSAISELSGPGIALGVEGQHTYTENAMARLPAGDIVVIATDGLWETVGPDGSFFGKQRLQQVIQENAGKPAAVICDALLAAPNTFREELKQQDDISVVVVKALDLKRSERSIA